MPPGRGRCGRTPLPDNDAATRQAEYMASHLGDIDPLGYVRVTDADGAMIAYCPARLPLHLGELMRRLDEATRRGLIDHADSPEMA